MQSAPKAHPVIVRMEALDFMEQGAPHVSPLHYPWQTNPR